MKTKNIIAIIIFSVFVIIILGLFIAHIIKQCKAGQQTIVAPEFVREQTED